MRIIDISKHNWNAPIDFKKVKAAGIGGVIIRAGYGKVINQKDPCFEKSYAGALAAGLHIGAYWYSYAVTPDEATAEAKVFLEAVKSKKFDLPLYFDIEEEKQVKLGKAVCTAMAVNFCTHLEKAGYFAGVYSFDSFFASNLDISVQNKYTCWVARVENVKPSSCGKYDMHQYSWKGRVNGVYGDVDMNDCTRDFPVVIKNAGLNGYVKAQLPAVKPAISIVASISVDDPAKVNNIKSTCEKLGMKVMVG